MKTVWKLRKIENAKKKKTKTKTKRKIEEDRKRQIEENRKRQIEENRKRQIEKALGLKLDDLGCSSIGEMLAFTKIGKKKAMSQVEKMDTERCEYSRNETEYQSVKTQLDKLRKIRNKKRDYFGKFARLHNCTVEEIIAHGISAFND